MTEVGVPDIVEVGAPKRVVYLWGAGATQAEVSYSGVDVNVAMQNNDVGEGVSTRIIKRLDPVWQAAFSSTVGIDIEKLISLLAGSGTDEYERLATNIRRLYFEDICSTLGATPTISRPTLAQALFTIHANQELMKYEVLSAVITTNHDGLLQLASQLAHGGVNLGIGFEAEDLTFDASLAPVLQLHGSFTWTFGLPLRVALLNTSTSYSPVAVWMPPSILKEARLYPFNKLAALAYEILAMKCDVLRVVGSSLTQNDWNILSMLFYAQRHREASSLAPFRIELIMPTLSGDSIINTCSYLRNLIPIAQLTDGDFADYSDPDRVTGDKTNALYYWLQQKVLFHQRQGQLGGPPYPSVLVEISGDTI